MDRNRFFRLESLRSGASIAAAAYLALVPSLLMAQPAVAPAPTANNLALWAILAIGVAVVLFFIELFVPSGLLGVLSVICLIVGIVLLFRVDTTIGLVGAIVCLIFLPIMFVMAVKIWPQTPIARLLLLRSEGSDGNGGGSGTTGNADGTDSDHEATVGAKGRAISDLHPVGTCLIDGRRIECLAEDGLINAGSQIRVVAVDGMHIKVRQGES